MRYDDDDDDYDDRPRRRRSSRRRDDYDDDDDFDDRPRRRRSGFECPNCGTSAPPRFTKQISPVGWVVFVLLLITTIIFCWVGLLITEEKRICSRCGYRLS